MVNEAGREGGRGAEVRAQIPVGHVLGDEYRPVEGRDGSHHELGDVENLERVRGGPWNRIITDVDAGPGDNPRQANLVQQRMPARLTMAQEHYQT